MQSGEAFLDAYRRLEAHLRRSERASESVPYGDLIDRSQRVNRITPDQALRLRTFGYLRNALSHWDRDQGVAIADPRPDALAEFMALVSSVTEPRTVISVLQQAEVKGLREDTDRLGDFLRLVNEYDFDQAPVRRLDGSMSVLTVRMVARWLATKKSTQRWDFRRHDLTAVLDCYDPTQDKFKIVPSDIIVPKALAWFAPDLTERVKGLLLLNHGQVVGLVVESDISRLIKAI